MHAAVEEVREESIHTRRVLAQTVLIEGLASIAVGSALMIPDDHDLAWRFAGIHTAVFGAINTAVSVYALRGIAAEERRWNALPAADRRRHAILDERGESVSHGVNLGLDFAYLGVGVTAIVASRSSVDHPNRWLGAGIAVSTQALFLVGIDVIGLARSKRYHAAFVPTASIAPHTVTIGAMTSF